MSEKEVGLVPKKFDLALEDSYLARAFMFLADGEAERARERFDEILDRDYKCAEAHLGLLLIELGLSELEELSVLIEPFDESKNYKRALEYAREELAAYLSECAVGAMTRYEGIIANQRAILEAEEAAREEREAREREEREREERERAARTQGRRTSGTPHRAGAARGAARANPLRELLGKMKKKLGKVGYIAVLSFMVAVAVFLVGAIIVALIPEGDAAPGTDNNPPVIEGDFTFLDRGEYYAVVNCASLAEEITVPTEYRGKPVKEIGAAAFENKVYMKKINLPYSIEIIGDAAFRGCSALKEIVIPAGVASLGDSMFYGCSALESVVLPEIPRIGDFAFARCASLSAISIPGTVTEIGEYAFYYSGALVSLDIPDSVSAVGQFAFFGCASLDTLSFGSGTRTIGEGAFYGCSGLRNLKLNNGLISIEKEAFSGCSALSELRLPSSIKHIGESAFRECSSLERTLLPLGVESVGAFAFSGCNNIIVYCQNDSQPSGWDSYWSNNSNVFWGHTADKCIEDVADGYCDYCGRALIENPEPPEVNPSAYFAYGIIGDEVIIKKYVGIDAVAIIPSTIEGKPVTTIAGQAFYGCRSVKSIVIGDNVTSIGDSAFYGCVSLESITVSEYNTAYLDINGNLYTKDGQTLVQYAVGKKDTSFTIPDTVRFIGNSAFRGCASLRSVVITESAQNIGTYAFSDCVSLTNIVIGECMESIGDYAFAGCALSRVVIPGTVASIGYSAFSGCSGLGSVIITEGAEKIGARAFENCAGLGSVFIPMTVSSIGEYAFLGCSNITIYCEASEYPELPDGWDDNWNPDGRAVEWGHTAAVCLDENADGLCDKCARETDNAYETPVTAFTYRIEGGNVYITSYIGLDSVVVIPKEIEGQAVTHIDYQAFSGCSHLTSVLLPRTLVSIGNNAFMDCTALTRIKIPASVRSIGNFAFYGCTALDNIIVDEDNEYYTSVDGILYTAGEKKLIQYPIGREDTVLTLGIGVIEIADYAFSGATYLERVTLPDGLATIGQNAFSKCSSLLSVDMPNSVTTIRNYAFANCTSLTSIKIPNGVTYLHNYTFDGCTALASFVVEDSHSSYKTVGGDLYSKDGKVLYFYAIGKSETMYVVPSDVEVIESCAFRYATSLKKIIIMSGVKTIGSYAFRYCDGLENIFIPATVEQVDSYAFYNCPGLVIYAEVAEQPSGWNSVFMSSDASIVWGHTADVCLDENEDGLCDKCDRGTANQPPNPTADFTHEIVGEEVTITKYVGTDTTVIIPREIEGRLVTRIGDRAFENCASLESVVIPDSITGIGDYVFLGCSSLANITVSADNTAYKDIDGNLYSKSGMVLRQYAVGKTATSFAIPATVTTIGDSAFDGCTSLEEITIPNSVMMIFSSTFKNCTSLKTLALPSKLASIGHSAFLGCSSLETIMLPSSVTAIGFSAFSGCDSLTIYCEAEEKPSGWHSDWNSDSRPVEWGHTADVCLDGNADGLCDKCGRETENTTGSNAEYDYTIQGGKVTINKYKGEATEVVIPSEIQGKPVTSIGYQAFYCCDSVTSITIPEGVTSIEDDAFNCCISLRSVTIPDSVTSIGDMVFFDCEILQNITVADNNTAYKSIDGNLYTKDGKTLIHYAQGKNDTSFVITNGVETIGDFALYNCGRLASVVIPSSVKSIGDSAFYNCRGLESIFIPNSVVSIGNEAFAECVNIKIYCEAAEQPDGWSLGWSPLNPIVEWGHTAAVCFDGNADGLCDKCGRETANQPTTPDTPEANPATDFTYTISGDEVTITKYKGSNTSVVIPSTIEGKPVTSIGTYAFEYRISLSSVVIPDSVTSIGNSAFNGCTSLSSIVIPDSITRIGSAVFFNCTSLSSVLIPDSTTSISANAFYGCTSLTIYCEAEQKPSGWASDWNISNCPVEWGHTADVCLDGNADGLCDKCGRGTANEPPNPATDFTYEIVGDEVTITKYNRTASEVRIPATIDGKGVTSIGSYAFYNCTSLTSIEIPDSVTSIGSSAFSHCTSLTSIVIPDSVTNIGSRAFSDCTSLTSIVIPDGVTSIGSEAFRDCTSLTSIEIPDSVTSIDSYAFYNCTSLTSVVIGNSVTSIGIYAFYNCTSLTIYCEVAEEPDGWYDDWNISNCSVEWGHTADVCLDGNEDGLCDKCGRGTANKPNPATDFTYTISGDEVTITKYKGSDTTVVIPSTIEGKPVTKIAVQAFYNCTSLSSIEIPNSVTSIGNNAFEECTSLESVVIGNSVTSIDYCAFYNCYSLTSIEIPNSVTSIGDGAFSGCNSLEIVIIPDSVTSMGRCVFLDCSLSIIYCEAEEKPNGWDDEWNVEFYVEKPENYNPVEWGHTADVCLDGDDDGLCNKCGRETENKG